MDELSVENDSVYADVARRSRAEELANDQALERSIPAFPVMPSDSEPSSAAPGTTQDAGGETAPVPVQRPQHSPVQSPEDESRPWIGWDVLTAVGTGPLKGLLEVGDLAGDVIGAETDLTDEFDKAREGTALEVNSVAGQMVESLGQFALPFGAALKGLKILNWAHKGWKASAAAGFAADFAAFDPKEGNLSNLIKEHAPSLNSHVTEYLAHDDDDGALEGRLKNAIEGLGLGLMGDALFRLIKGQKFALKPGQSFDMLSPADLARIDPAFKSRLTPAMENLRVARERYDLFKSGQETLRALDEADPAFVKAREYLKAKAAGVADDALPELTDDAARLVEAADVSAGQAGISPLEHLELQSQRAKSLSPLAALEKEDAALAASIRKLLGDGADGLEPGEFDRLLAETTNELKAAGIEWEKVRTDAAWDSLPDGYARSIDEAVTANRHNPDSGFRLIREEVELDQRIRSTLSRQGRLKAQPKELLTSDIDGALRASLGDTAPKPTRNLFKGIDGIKVSREDHDRILRSVAEGDVAEVTRIMARGTNMNYVLADDTRVQNLYAELGRMYKAKEKVIDWAKVQADNDAFMAKAGKYAEDDPAKLDVYLKELMGDDPELSNQARMMALRTMEGMLAERTMQLSEQVLNGVGNTRLVAEFSQAATALLRMNDSRRTLQADIARTLNSMKIPVLAQGVDARVIDQIVKEGVKDPRRLAAQIRASVGDPASLSKLRKSIENPGLKALTSYWYASLLSGPITHAVNVTSNLGVAVMRPGEDILGGLFTGQWNKVQEGVEALFDLYDSVGGSFAAAAKSFDIGESMLGHHISPFDHTNPEFGPFHHLVEGKNGPAYTLTRAISKTLGVPSRMLIAEDEMFRGMNYFVHVRREARRHIRQTKPHLKGREFEAEVLKFAKDASEWAEFSNRLPGETRAELKAVHEKALVEAQYNTFTNDLDEVMSGGKSIGGSIQNMLHKHPALRIIMPFVRTPTNIFRFAIQRVPLAGLIQDQNKQLWRAAKAGNKDALRDIVGRQVMGTAISGVAGLMFLQGRLTGGGPKDPGQKEAWLSANAPYSVRVGDQWISYRKLEPFGMIIGLLADAATAASELADDDAVDADGLAAGVLASITSNLTSKRYLQGITEFLGMVARGDTEQWSQYMLKQSGNLVPLAQGVSQVNRALFDPQLKELTSFKDAIDSKIPLLSQSVESRMNMWGEPINLPPGFRYGTLPPMESGQTHWVNSALGMLPPVGAFQNRSAITSPVREKLAEIKFGINLRATYGRMDDVKLTPAQRNKWLKLTNKLPGSETTLEEKVHRLLFERMPDDATDEFQREEVRKLIHDARHRAQKWLLANDPEFADVRKKSTEAKLMRKVKTRQQEHQAREKLRQLESITSQFQ